jgi:wyosine [tRNA(Phe)-imidazoG37] synthetase (radical SAM superfamily)
VNNASVTCASGEVSMTEKVVFGPVPSRRLGMSLGVNNILYKNCSYSCVYCQLGRTQHFEIERDEYYNPEELVRIVREAEKSDALIDYITFVPDGEPTLDKNLGFEIAEIKKEDSSTKVAVITNASLIYREDVRAALYDGDTVSIKVDAITPEIWKQINRPHPKLKLDGILDGIVKFSEKYKGRIITETMLIKGVNDQEDEITKIAQFLSGIKVDVAYIAIPTRPPAEVWVEPADEKTILMAHEIFSNHLGKNHVELLTGYEEALFDSVSKDPIRGFLAITSVHPMMIDYVDTYFSERGLQPEEVINKLLEENKIVKLSYMDHEFILRKFKSDKTKT